MLALAAGVTFAPAAGGHFDGSAVVKGRMMFWGGPPLADGRTPHFPLTGTVRIKRTDGPALVKTARVTNPRRGFSFRVPAGRYMLFSLRRDVSCEVTVVRVAADAVRRADVRCFGP